MSTHSFSSSPPLDPPAQAQKQPRNKRSHQGCWTCKQKRRRCDNTRPECLNCLRLGIQCEGYEVRLRWGIGIASRGRFTGADKPLEESIPSRPKGRLRDLEKKRKLSEGLQREGGRNDDPSMGEQQQTLVMNQTAEPVSGNFSLSVLSIDYWVS